MTQPAADVLTAPVLMGLPVRCCICNGWIYRGETAVLLRDGWVPAGGCMSEVGA